MPHSEDSRTTASGTIRAPESLDPNLLLKAARQSMRIKGWRWRRLSELRQTLIRQELIYHPLWMGKILTFADRPPFPPKRIPNAAFIDAVSGYRGVLERIPEVDRQTYDDGEHVKPVIENEQQARRYVQAVLHTVNRGYVLKKPQHQLASLELLHLPLWKVTFQAPEARVVYINAVTGEPETYMARQWNSTAWLTLDESTLVALKATAS